MHKNGIITAPIGIDSDIPQVLGVSSTDLGYLCSNEHGKINWRSKKKPVRWNDPAINMKNSKWWIGENGDCGLAPSVKGPLNSVINGTWNYEAPDSSHWKRALDFEGYNHYAGNPINHGYNMGIQIDKIKEKTLRIMFAVDYGDDYKFSPADMESLKNTYLTAYITNGSHSFKISAPDIISGANQDDATTITIPVSEFYVGEYTCYIVFSTAKFILGQAEPSTNFYPYISDTMNPSSFKINVIQVSPVEINFDKLSYSATGTFITVQDAGDIFADDTAYIMYTNGDVAVTMSVYNKGTDPVNILRNQLRMSTRTIWDTDIVRDGTMYDGNTITQGITISGGQTKTIKLLFDKILLYDGNSIKTPTTSVGKLKTIFATMRYYSVDGSSWAAAGGSAVYNMKYSSSNSRWSIETINQ